MHANIQHGDNELDSRQDFLALPTFIDFTADEEHAHSDCIRGPNLQYD